MDSADLGGGLVKVGGVEAVDVAGGVHYDGVLVVREGAHNEGFGLVCVVDSRKLSNGLKESGLAALLDGYHL